ncbi:MAG: hypothetical protein IJ371_00945 [Clostridia bacterium]|nr:hypothetical protein [Clostridia bacterium]
MNIFGNKTMSIPEIKNLLTQNVGKKVRITESNKQGKVIKEFTGEIVNTYTSIFVISIKVNTKFLNKSFSYVEFLTNELSIEIW